MGTLALAPHMPQSIGRTGRVTTKRREFCTFASKVDARCMELNGFASAEAPAYKRSEQQERDLYACYNAVRVFQMNTASARGELQWNSLSDVVDLRQRLAKDAGLASDPASNGCIAAADATSGGLFSYAVAIQDEKSELSKTLEHTFSRTCKTNAWLGSQKLGEFNIVLNERPKKPSTKVVIEKTSPPYKVLCNGDIVMTLPDGSTTTAAPHYDSDRRLADDFGRCVAECSSSSEYADVCQVKNDPRCKSRCEAHCTAH